MLDRDGLFVALAWAVAAVGGWLAGWPGWAVGFLAGGAVAAVGVAWWYAHREDVP